MMEKMRHDKLKIFRTVNIDKILLPEEMYMMLACRIWRSLDDQ